jgi:hypothetical protein
MALSAHATPIIGQINITAFDVVLTPNQLGAVTSVGGSTDGLVSNVSGGTTSYPTTLVSSANLVTYAPFSVTVGLQSINPLWSVNDLANGYNYSFDLVSITSVVQNSQNLDISGTGNLLSTNPLATGPTAGLWTYDITSSSGLPTMGYFSFQSNNDVKVSVPDNGNTLILIGAGMLGLVGLGWRSKKASRRQPMMA